jgi:hypothetical protein
MSVLLLDVLLQISSKTKSESKGPPVDSDHSVVTDLRYLRSMVAGICSGAVRSGVLHIEDILCNPAPTNTSKARAM